MTEEGLHRRGVMQAKPLVWPWMGKTLCLLLVYHYTSNVNPLFGCDSNSSTDPVSLWVGQIFMLSHSRKMYYAMSYNWWKLNKIDWTTVHHIAELQKSNTFKRGIIVAPILEQFASIKIYTNTSGTFGTNTQIHNYKKSIRPWMGKS